MRKYLAVTLLTSSLLLSASSSASAAIEGFVVEDSSGNYIEYNAAELVNSFIQKNLGNEQEAKFYNDFAARGTMIALKDGANGLIDYNDVLNAAIAAALDRKPFNADEYTEGDTAKRSAVDPTVVKTAKMQDGKVIVEEPDSTEFGVVAIE